MNATTTESPIEESADLNTAEDICKLLEQTVLKYFPQEVTVLDQPRPSSELSLQVSANTAHSVSRKTRILGVLGLLCGLIVSMKLFITI
jgi:hypothetical protein